jgi:putative oxidoreductase
MRWLNCFEAQHKEDWFAQGLQAVMQSPRAMNRLQNFPFVSPAQALVVLRIALAIFFMAHAAVRIYLPGSIPSFVDYLSHKGWPFSLAIVWLITAYELSAGTLLILGKWVRWCAAGLFFIAAMGIVIIHAGLGWFVGEHGTGGMEYSLCLMVSLLVIAAFDAQQNAAARSFAAHGN